MELNKQHKITLLTYYSQVNYKGAVQRHQMSTGSLPFSPPRQARQFYLRPKPHLGACSQATYDPSHRMRTRKLACLICKLTSPEVPGHDSVYP